MPASLAAPSSILVINVSRIGDTLLTTPVLRALARAWPQAHIRFMGHPRRVEVVAHAEGVADTAGITKRSAVLRGRLPARRWDLALVYGFDRALVAYALRVAHRVVAFRQDEPALDGRLYRAVPPPAFQQLHSAEIPLLLTRALGVPDAGMRLSYTVTADERRWARAFLAERVDSAAKPLVGLQVASFPTKAYRDWPLECFAQLCARLRSRWPRAHFLLFGGAGDKRKTAWIKNELGGHATVLAGTTTLRQSASLMNELDLYVGVDTGPTHIMGALDRPMVALYHCYSPSRLLRPLERARCHAVDHPRGEGCSPQTPMAEIPVESVWTAAVEALAEA